MNGQWIGAYTGTANGMLILNIDDRISRFEGLGYILPTTRELPVMGVGFRTPGRAKEFQFTTEDFLVIDPKTWNPAPWETIKELYDAEVKVSKSAEELERETRRVRSRCNRDRQGVPLLVV
jgi:hypothetical protein